MELTKEEISKTKPIPQMRAYLAHPTNSREYVRAWELEMEREYGLEFINPFYDVGGIEGENIEKLDRGEIIIRPYGYDSYLVHRDIECIAKSDFVVAIIDGNPSYGTIMEIVYATLLKKPVYLIITADYGKNHPWLNHHSTGQFYSLSEFETYLRLNKDVNFIGMKWPM